jgi:hypothetical protein
MMAIQKLGLAMPRTANNLPKVSRIDPRFTADRSPGYAHDHAQQEDGPG